MFTFLGIIFSLFVVLFVAIIIEETLVGGRRRRRLLKKAREAQGADEPREEL
jgi:hypothetical protein